MCREGSDADLDQTFRQSLFHYPREGTCVRVSIALVVIVEIGMRIEMEHAEIWKLARERSYDRIGDGVISAEGDRRHAVGDQRVDGVVDQGKHVAARNRLNVTCVEEAVVTGKIGSVLACQVPRVGTECSADLWRRISGAFSKRRVLVVANANDCEFGALFSSAGRIFGHTDASGCVVGVRIGALWCTRQGSNLRPFDSNSNALSNGAAGAREEC